MPVSSANARDPLEARFVNAWRAVRGTRPRHAYRDIVERYRSGRFYHDYGHIRSMFAVADRILPHVRLSPEFVIAVFLHDAVYDPGRQDNERRSADLARAMLPDAEPRRIDRIARLIEATESHTSDDPEAQLFIDLDLCFLGLDARAFDNNVDKLTREFAHLPRSAFLSGQAAYLKPFLERPHIYYTEPFRRHFEQAARHNLEHFIQTYRERA